MMKRLLLLMILFISLASSQAQDSTGDQEPSAACVGARAVIQPASEPDAFVYDVTAGDPAWSSFKDVYVQGDKGAILYTATGVARTKQLCTGWMSLDDVFASPSPKITRDQLCMSLPGGRIYSPQKIPMIRSIELNMKYMGRKYNWTTQLAPTKIWINTSYTNEVLRSLAKIDRHHVVDKDVPYYEVSDIALDACALHDKVYKKEKEKEKAGDGDDVQTKTWLVGDLPDCECPIYRACEVYSFVNITADDSAIVCYADILCNQCALHRGRYYRSDRYSTASTLAAVFILAFLFVLVCTLMYWNDCGCFSDRKGSGGGNPSPPSPKST